MQLIEEADAVSTKFYKNLIGSDGIVEVRVQHGTNHIRLLGFESNGTFVILTNAFRKKDQKVPKKEIALAQERKKDADFAKDFNSWYEEFKIGEMLKQARVEVGLTQEDLAQKLHTKSRLYHELKIMRKI